VELSTEFGKQLNKEHYIYFWQFAKGEKITFEAATAGDHMAFSRQKVSLERSMPLHYSSLLVPHGKLHADATNCMQRR
jgi:hypothetical protein